LNTDISLSRFNNVFNNSGVYYAAAKTMKDIKIINMLLRILTFIPYTGVESDICNHCNQEYTDLPLHILTTCPLTQVHRDILIDCIAIYFPFQILIDINSMCREEHLLANLGKQFNELLVTDNDLYQTWLLLNAAYCYMAYSDYYNIKH
jgi:hypothetical protein